MQKKAVHWYKRNDTDGTVYYATDRVSRTRYHIPGPGDRIPTPNEVADLLREVRGGEAVLNGLLVRELEAEHSNEDPVELPGGYYQFIAESYSDLPDRLVPLEIREDSYVQVSEVYDGPARDIRQFIQSKHVYRELGFQYRRGILLYGPPGNGKTSIIRHLIRHELPKDAVVILLNTIPAGQFLRSLNQSLTGRFKVFVFEELAAVVSERNLDSVLSFLDGENSLDHCLVLATTNYPARLPGNIVDRPSRFDRLYKLSDPDKSARRALLSGFLQRELTEVEVTLTQGLSVAALREIAILMRVNGSSMEEATLALQKHKQLVKRQFGEMAAIGLKRDED